MFIDYGEYTYELNVNLFYLAEMISLTTLKSVLRHMEIELKIGSQ